jgi:hypothetical protein
VNGRILAILGRAPTEPVAIAMFERLANTLVAWWDNDDDERQGGRHGRSQRNHEVESALMDLLQNFLLRTSAQAATTIIQPILGAIDRHSQQCKWLLLGLIGAEDREPNTEQFWSLWRLFADRVRGARWMSQIDDERPEGRELLLVVFLGTSWKDEVRHWRSLEGHAGEIHALFEESPASSTVLDDYVRFLYHVGEQSLPGAFIRVAKRLSEGDRGQMLKKGNTVFLLELLLQRYVYGKPLELKRQNNLRDAVLALLDMLIVYGSSAAFRMRDDFVTPVPIP